MLLASPPWRLYPAQNFTGEILDHVSASRSRSQVPDQQDLVPGAPPDRVPILGVMHWLGVETAYLEGGPRDGEVWRHEDEHVLIFPSPDPNESRTVKYRRIVPPQTIYRGEASHLVYACQDSQVPSPDA